MAQMCCQLVPWFYKDVWGPESLWGEESLTPMTRMLVLWGLLWERSRRASNGMIRQDIECENMKMQCGMFKGSIYEYLMSLRWRFVRRIHGNEKQVVRGMLRSTRFDGRTVMVDLEWGIRVAQQNMVKVWRNWCCKICDVWNSHMYVVFWNPSTLLPIIVRNM